MVMRIRLEDLGDDVRERLARGEPVEIERDGEVVATIPAKYGTEKGGLAAFLEARKNAPPLDEDFKRDLEEIRQELNQPPRDPPWD